MSALRLLGVVVGVLRQVVYMLILNLSACQVADLLMCREVVPVRRGSQGKMNCCGHDSSFSRHVREGLVLAALAIRKVFEGARTAEPVDSRLDAVDEIWSWSVSVHDRQSQAW